MVWTNADNVARLRELATAGVSGAEIARRLSGEFDCEVKPRMVHHALQRFCGEVMDARRSEQRSRHGAMAEKVFGDFLAGRSAREIASKRRMPLFEVYRQVPPDQRLQRAQMTANIDAPMAKFPVPEDPITEAGKNFLQLDSDDCRWPIGRDADGGLRFCGCLRAACDAAGILVSRMYCEGHGTSARSRVLEPLVRVSEAARQASSTHLPPEEDPAEHAEAVDYYVADCREQQLPIAA